MRKSEVNAALNQPRLSYGVSSSALGYCWGLGAFLAVLVGTSQGWWWSLLPLGVAAGVHSLLVWAYSKDPRIFEMYEKYSKLSTTYHPHARETLPTPFERPEKVGRGVRL